MREFFQKKKNLVILVVLILALPVGIFLITQQQIFKSRATVGAIVFSGNNVTQRADGSWRIVDGTNPTITLQLTTTLGTTQTPCSRVALSLDPPSGNLKLGQNNEIGVKLLPNGCDVTAVELGLNYVSITLSVSGISPGSGAFGLVEAGDSSEGGRHYIFTRTPGSTLPQEIIIGKILFRPTDAATASKGVFVNIVGVAGSDGLPYITVSGQGNLPAAQKTVTSGTYNIL